MVAVANAVCNTPESPLPSPGAGGVVEEGKEKKKLSTAKRDHLRRAYVSSVLRFLLARLEAI